MGSEQARKRQNSLQRNHRGIQNTYHTWLTFSHSLLCREATVKSPQLILMALLHPGVTTPCLSYREYFTGGRGNHPLPGVINSFKMLLEKAMAPHSSTLAWKIPWTEEPGGLQSMGSLRVRHDLATSLSLFTFMHWRRKWQLTPVFLPGESQGPGSLVGCRLWGRRVGHD